MSVGRITGSPARIASTDCVDHGARPSTTRSRPARSRRDRDLLVAEPLRAGRCDRRGPGRLPTSSTSAPPGRERLAAPRGRPPRGRLRRRAPRAARAHLGLERVELVGGDVRRVRDHEVERALLAGEQVAVDEPHPSVQGRAAPVLLGDLERGRGDVGGDDPGIGPLVRDRERDRAGADADVEDAWEPRRREGDRGSARRRSRSPAAGSGRGGSTTQRQPSEAPLAEDVGERLARGAPRDERPEAVELVGRELPLRRCAAHSGARPRTWASSHSASTSGEGRLGPLERGRALGESLSNGHTAAASSARRRSSSPSAPVNSSSSPPSTASSRCAVSLTR